MLNYVRMGKPGWLDGGFRWRGWTNRAKLPLFPDCPFYVQAGWNDLFFFSRPVWKARKRGYIAKEISLCDLLDPHKVDDSGGMEIINALQFYWSDGFRREVELCKVRYKPFDEDSFSIDEVWDSFLRNIKQGIGKTNDR